MRDFSELSLKEPLRQALAEVGYGEMTKVQAASLPILLAGTDALIQAQTGSGKTAAFALALLSSLDVATVQLQGLVLCPTRELADQVSREIRRLARFIPNTKVLTLCGGVPLRPHLASLNHAPHIAVGTPGRILDLIGKGALLPATLRVLVLDEADRMLDMGFSDSIRAILATVPVQRQTVLCSATIPASIREISREFQRNACDITLTVDPDQSRIDEVFFEVDAETKLDALQAVLLHYRPESAVVFCNTRQDVRTVAEQLDARGFCVAALHGDLEQRERDEILVRFANRSCTVLVASDVAARGLDIAELPMVINFDLASDPDTHVHRTGRTGRAGRGGTALTLCTWREVERARAIEARSTGKPRWEKVPATSSNSPLRPPFVTLAVDAGRRDKLRPGDIVGALTGEAGIPGAMVGKITVFPTRTYVAIAREWHEDAHLRLRQGKIKGRTFRIRRIGA